MAQKVPKQVLAYDLGGTKVAVGIVDENGKVVEAKRVPVMLEKGKDAVLQQLIALGRDFLRRYPGVKRVGMASAGPLHPKKGLLLDPTNFASKKGPWGIVPIVSILSKGLERPVYLDNDAAAAILAEKWVGAAKNFESAMILTLGTGLGTGIVIDGKLMRAGQGLHPEAGHIILNYKDETAVCGCGNIGCAEAYLSGNGFARWANKQLARGGAAISGTRSKRGSVALQGPELATLARKGNRRVKALFIEYGRLMAAAIQSYTVIFEPQIIVLTGSFAETRDLFMPTVESELKRMFTRRVQAGNPVPKIAVSKLKNYAGLIGGAYVAFFHK
jgi:glucokinase